LEFKDREVFARWLAFSCLSGLMEIGGVGRHAPWDMPTEPAYDQEMIDIYRKYTVLRETLLPYVVAAAAEASTGVPIVRPMTFENRKDKRLRDRWDQYLFGPDLLVAPVWRVGQRSREVYLPKGRWRSYWDPSQVWKGRRTITVEAPLDHIPVFVRDGTQVPGP
jgi:alpha-glucosidase (family GH31 glycosyl hydrolase)